MGNNSGGTAVSSSTGNVGAASGGGADGGGSGRRAAHDNNAGAKRKADDDDAEMEDVSGGDEKAGKPKKKRHCGGQRHRNKNNRGNNPNNNDGNSRNNDQGLGGLFNQLVPRRASQTVSVALPQVVDAASVDYSDNAPSARLTAGPGPGQVASTVHMMSAQTFMVPSMNDPNARQWVVTGPVPRFAGEGLLTASERLAEPRRDPPRSRLSLVTGNVCAWCQERDPEDPVYAASHTLRDCVWPTRMGDIPGCPVCNTVQHQFEGCPARQNLSADAARQQAFDLLVRSRGGLPPYRTTLPWPQLAVGFDTVQLPAGYPATKDFASAQVLLDVRPFQRFHHANTNRHGRLLDDPGTVSIDVVRQNLAALSASEVFVGFHRRTGPTAGNAAARNPAGNTQPQAQVGAPAVPPAQTSGGAAAGSTAVGALNLATVHAPPLDQLPGENQADEIASLREEIARLKAQASEAQERDQRSSEELKRLRDFVDEMKAMCRRV